MTIEKREAMAHIAVRLPPDVVRQVKNLARKKRCTPSDVYRTIIASFFENPVNKTETDLKTERSKEPA